MWSAAVNDPADPGPQHRRQVVADVAAPRGQGRKPIALEVRLGTVLAGGGLDHGGVQPDHDHCPPLLLGFGRGAA
jgi:hypothetical protein